MSNSQYHKLVGQNMWKMDDIEPITYKKYIDKWDVDVEYPFKITQQHVEEYTDAHKEKLEALTDREKMLMKMNLNSFYGAYGGITPSSTNMFYGGGATFNHPGGGLGLKSLYYRSSIGKAKQSRTVPHEETAICIQKEYLIEHFEHKLSKTSIKKKEEVKTLTNIVTMYKNEVLIYMNDFPERFI